MGTVKDDGKITTGRVHRLVAIAYIENPEDKPVVNHKNGNIEDNKVENLEWNTVSENTKHGYDKLGVLSAQSKPCILKINGEVYSTYQSISYLSREVGFNRNYRTDKTCSSIEDITDNYFVVEEVRDAKEYSESKGIPFNKKVWVTEGYTLNTRGRFYKTDGEYFDRVSDIVEYTGLEKSSVHRLLREGLVSRKGYTVEEVSGKEYLKNCKHRNW